ncbi:MAG: aminotransferase class V-fold PLP-dependent enzyme [Anaerolineae bacterium]|nr:aminotransferase class V-fold PLP-dependent enzyme [Anaerolineae bacterium]
MPVEIGYDVHKVRALLPVLREYNYLNVGTYGIVAEPVLARSLERLRNYDARGVAAYEEVIAGQEQARAHVARALGAHPEEIAFTGNATDGVNLVTAGLTWQEGDEVIISNEEHPAVTFPWYYLQQRGGPRVKQFHVQAAEEPVLAELAQLVTPHTRLIATSHVSHRSGTRLPVAGICKWARERGILTLLDGAQAFAQFPIDVHVLGCDFYTTNGHKWLCGPKGTGIFYVRREVLPLTHVAHTGAGAMRAYNLENLELVPSARRFEFGTRSHALYEGLDAALDWFDRLGWEAIERHLAWHSAYLKSQVLARPGFKLHSPVPWAESSALVTISVDGMDAHTLANNLRTQHRTITPPVAAFNALRISTAYFVIKEDLDRLLAILDRMVTE